jgi:hypothetical protein
MVMSARRVADFVVFGTDFFRTSDYKTGGSAEYLWNGKTGRSRAEEVRFGEQSIERRGFGSPGQGG